MYALFKDGKQISFCCNTEADVWELMSEDEILLTEGYTIEEVKNVK